jgi:DNA-binding CsgD family transcriptional regulator
MPTSCGSVAESESFRNLDGGAQILDRMQEFFRSFGATHFLATGLPLPGRLIEPLILRMVWDVRGDRPPVDPSDPVFQLALRAHRAFFLPEEHDRIFQESPLCASVRAKRLVMVPIWAFHPYQAAVIGAGTDFTLDLRTTLTLDHYCTAGFRRLFALGYLHKDRPGDLSARERRVLELSAVGKTANEIASVLQISQRTVHAHLQNASEKLRASNKTHTVVEALLYGQISV